MTKRWFDWDPRVTRKDGKPAITGTKSVYVTSLIPVVLIKDTPGLGNKGEIRHVKRGFARNVLIPEGAAVYGTVWENIDSFADPLKLTENLREGEATAKSSTAPFHWINAVRLEFLRDTAVNQQRGGSSELTEVVTVSDILNSLSSLENVDLLPSHLTLPEEGITTVGCHCVTVELNLVTGTHRYSISVDVKDRAEVAAAERREAELREAMKLKRPDFVLGTSRFSEAGAGHNLTDTNTDYEESGDADDSDDEN